MSMLQRNQGICWKVFSTAEDGAQAAYRQILEVADEAIEARGCFNLVLAGGQTPERVYSLLSQANANWSFWHLYYGDERCLPALHPELNSQMVKRVLTSQVKIPKNQVHRIPVELGSEVAACRYAEVLKHAVPFDLVLLGLGEDGHTASLFPGHDLLSDQLVVPVFGSPKPPKERVSLSVDALSSCRNLIFLVTGLKKSRALSCWKNGALLPASQIGSMGSIDIFVDKAAWGDEKLKC